MRAEKKRLHTGLVDRDRECDGAFVELSNLDPPPYVLKWYVLLQPLGAHSRLYLPYQARRA